VDPSNVILNYAYAILEGQIRHALSAAGFDLACGFLHADRRGRFAQALVAACRVPQKQVEVHAALLQTLLLP
jgi:hypothetical protein